MLKRAENPRKSSACPNLTTTFICKPSKVMCLQISACKGSRRGLVWPIIRPLLYRLTEEKLACHRLSFPLVQGSFAVLQYKYQPPFGNFCFKHLGIFLICTKRLEGLDNANTDVLNFIWTDELHSTLPYPGQRMGISHVALPWQTSCKCQQTQALHKLEDPSTKSQLGHLLSFRCLDVVLRDMV